MTWIAPFLLATLASVDPSSEFDPFVTAVPIEVQDFGEDCDADYDGLPDGWTRRSGPEFPHYVDARVDRRTGHDASGSLSIRSDGAAAVLYSKPIRIDSDHVHIFEAYVRTQKLDGDAAICSFSILDERMNRIGRYLTEPVSGTHADWVKLRIGPIEPMAAQRFVVVGCHLVCGKKLDLGGVAFFDDIRVGQTPLLTLSGARERLIVASQATQLDVGVSGTSPGSVYQLQLKLIDAFEAPVDHVHHEINTELVDDEIQPLSIPWTMPGLESGYYVLHATLAQEGRVVANRKTAFVVTEPISPLDHSPFGWSLKSLPTQMGGAEFARLATAAGMGHVKIPLWRDAADRLQANRSSDYIEQLSSQKIDVVGVLDPPPSELRRKFAADWAGAGEVYQLPESLWAPALAPVVARYGAKIQEWQLGQDGDHSFETAVDLSSMFDTLRRAFARVGRNSSFGVPWPNQAIVDQSLTGFVSVPTDVDSLAISRLPEKLELWSSIRPLPAAEYSPQERAIDLVRRIINARTSGATRVSLTETDSPEDALLDREGSPTELFLPWRATVLALRDLEDLGTLPMPQGSHNRVFGNRTHATIVVWNDEESTELLALGGTPRSMDLWGRQIGLPVDDSGLTQVKIGQSPAFLTGISPALLRWQIAARFESDKLMSRHGPQTMLLQGENPFDQGVSGTVTVVAPKGWDLETNQWSLRLAAGEAYRLPVVLSLPADTSLGTHRIAVKYEIQAERRYSFVVEREIIVGLGDVEIEVTSKLLPDGRLEVIQAITNQTSPEEVLNFRCDLFVPGEQRKRQYVVKLGQGRDVKRYFLANGESLIGEELRVRAEQENGRRVLNYRWTASSN